MSPEYYANVEVDDVRWQEAPHVLVVLGGQTLGDELFPPTSRIAAETRRTVLCVTTLALTCSWHRVPFLLRSQVVAAPTAVS